MTSPQHKVPKYMKQFACIGSACEDTCCAWWGISIDKHTYTKYQSVTNTSLRRKLKKNLSIKPQGSVQDYAEMQLNPNTGDCAMLDHGMCSIQLELGESYLSQTCRTYPRVINQAGNALEMTAQLSCPEVARLVLLDEQAMELVDVDLAHIGSVTYKHKAAATLDPNRPEFYFPEIREMMMEIMKYREFSLPHRLILLGVFCDNVNLLMDEKKYKELPHLCVQFREEVAHNDELRSYNVYPLDPIFQLQYLNNYLMDILDDTIWNARYRECIHDYKQGMTRNGSSLEAIAGTYDYSYEHYYKPFMDQHAHVLENFILNHLYSRMLAEMHVNIPVFDSYQMLVAEFAMIKLHLIGIAAHHQQLTEELTVKLIQSYTKNYEHTALFLKNILDDFKKQGYHTLGYMSLLIKND
ncbi:flagellin lysine-N-methylase [Paenibacillus sp. Leaf72]|uniref:flagellin lysine-N-methylase n=1 Tax=Paenibacillus sp. Leaf72 TaxID=1736234 RepID=UPI0026A90831